MNTINGFIFERFIGDLFKLAEYSVTEDSSMDAGYDLLVEKDNQKYCIEIKCSKPTREAFDRIEGISKQLDAKPVFITCQFIQEPLRRHLEDLYSSVTIIDISNLLFTLQYYERLRNELISLLPFTIDNIEPKECFLELDFLEHSDNLESLIYEIKNCKKGRSSANEYEDICHRLLLNIFSEDLALWQKQPTSNKALYRFDLICRIKDNNGKTFWKILEEYFNYKYVVFELKNYSKKITQKEIYTTEKYLYAKALRSVAIIITAKGFDENAMWATKGCLRENGKLIILLTSDDLIKMAEYKISQEDPSTYLLSKLDNLLIELEK